MMKAVVFSAVIAAVEGLVLRETGPNIDSHSQFGADKWIVSKHPQQGGYFIDIGAFDGKYGSNTYALEQRGWTGLCVEPMPKDFSMRKCKLLRVAVSNYNGTANFRQCGDAQLSGLESDAEVYRLGCKEVNVNIKSVHSLIAENLPADVRVVDYVNLDVEGTELKVLEDWPFDRACVKLWTVEHNNMLNKRPIGHFLESKGCKINDVKVDWWAECPCK
eukprot:TRINITY_DN2948_c0_g1_i1.p1 TRINITY_DN2948_c0_g1~~TRINITY_DN2948_c0_g1_i1.p1  ORF type:complete len:218 (-),score=53.12 TRINITY_DN2948_c0_g1_i1:110-763(-)